LTTEAAGTEGASGWLLGFEAVNHVGYAFLMNSLVHFLDGFVGTNFLFHFPHRFGISSKTFNPNKPSFLTTFHSINFKVMAFSFISTLKTDLFSNLLAISFRASMSKLQRI